METAKRLIKERFESYGDLFGITAIILEEGNNGEHYILSEDNIRELVEYEYKLKGLLCRGMRYQIEKEIKYITKFHCNQK